MLDFMMVSHRANKGMIEFYPKFLVKKPSDLMIKGSSFYAIWLEEEGVWSTDEYDAIRVIDQHIDEAVDKYRKANNYDGDLVVKYLWDADSGSIDKWHKYVTQQMEDCFKPLDGKLIFSNDPVRKEDYSSKRLDYSLEMGDFSSWDKLISTLYSPEERHKIEWSIGSIVTGESRYLQKFLVFYGAAGTGKSTIMNIIEQLFAGYCAVFDARSLGNSSSQFALESFRNNPLVAIQQDGDLSKLDDNTRLNSLVSHEKMTINEKYKSTYVNSFNTFLIMGTNKPVKITDAKSGLMRRLIDVSPTGEKIPPSEYKRLTKNVKFELGAIAWHCKTVYEENPLAYDNYIPKNMMSATNDFFNFMVDSYHIFVRQDNTTLKAAYDMYKVYCEEANTTPIPRTKFREELKNYFKNFDDRVYEDGQRVRSYYSGFRKEKFGTNILESKSTVDDQTPKIDFKEQESIFDKMCSECLAQYATNKETPKNKWDDISTKLSDLDTKKLHYVKIPENHIVIDFDIPDETGNKSFEKNLAAASLWPPTYAELSKSGKGIHLHYIYNGDVSKLSRIFEEHIEIKVFTGKASLRRRLTKCNDLPINTINSGLPIKEVKNVKFDSIKNERTIRTLIARNLNKEYHPGTKPSIDFIHTILEEAYNADIQYDVSDMKNSIIAFASGSTHQAEYCLKKVKSMKFRNDKIDIPEVSSNDDRLVFFDVEVFPNLFLICYKFEGEDKVHRLINPTAIEIDKLMEYKLVGFNCRRYDNHILYGWHLGYTNEQLYNLSQAIIGGETKNVMFGSAYDISYTDVYDFAAKKQSLKLWEIELGIHHQELGIPWDKPVDEELWDTVAGYCENDVIATEAVFHHLKGDFTARKILAELAGMTVNTTTNTLTTRIIFGNEKNPELVYTDLAEEFPGYEFIYSEEDNKWHNMYRGTDLSMGGYVYSEPGAYGNVALIDVESLHPHSILAMNCFGDYTQNFADLLHARMCIKHKNFDEARTMLSGRLSPYLSDETTAKSLSQALKIAINSVYGLTAANFPNPFRDERNKNNIVALRGALFMKTLQDEVMAKGYKVCHIKTDSIKIADATPGIIDFCMNFAKKYGYKFEHEATYDKMCLVNKSVYVARYLDADLCLDKYKYIPEKNEQHSNEWTATGKEFMVPYIFKTLFSKEPVQFTDYCEAKTVKTAIYLDLNESNESEHNYQFVGKTGLFVPIKPGAGGGLLVRESKNKGILKYDSVTGTKGYRWLEAEDVKKHKKEKDIDKKYFRSMVDDAINSLEKYVNVEWFCSDDIYEGSEYQILRELPFE